MFDDCKLWWWTLENIFSLPFLSSLHSSPSAISRVRNFWSPNLKRWPWKLSKSLIKNCLTSRVCTQPQLVCLFTFVVICLIISASATYTIGWLRIYAPNTFPYLATLQKKNNQRPIMTNRLTLVLSIMNDRHIDLAMGYICCIKRVGSPLHWVVWLDSTTECIKNTCCNGTDHSNFRLGCRKYHKILKLFKLFLVI